MKTKNVYPVFIFKFEKKECVWELNSTLVLLPHMY